MPFYAGQKGKMFMSTGTTGSSASSNEIAKVVNWSFNQTQNVIETTSLGDTDRLLCAGVRQLSGSCRVYYYKSGGRNDCARILSQVMPGNKSSIVDNATYGQNTESEPVVFRLFVEAGTNDKWVDIPAYITSVSMTMAVGEVLAADISFEATGAALSTSTIQVQ
jgi:hypothetical protein